MKTTLEQQKILSIAWSAISNVAMELNRRGAGPEEIADLRQAMALLEERVRKDGGSKDGQ
jgi:hypothetical protein